MAEIKKINQIIIVTDDSRDCTGRGGTGEGRVDGRATGDSRTGDGRGGLLEIFLVTTIIKRRIMGKIMRNKLFL